MINSQQLAASIVHLQASHKYWVAYSGGLDSHVLLHLAAQVFPREQLAAVHINHGLSAHANEWENHCKTVCINLNIGFHAISVMAHPAPGESPEAAARNARYAAFADLLQKNECLLTAHQQDDQAETVLLQMLRGGGVRGLAAMPAKKVFGQGFLLRPLLNYTRDELTAYAKAHHLQWIEDDSNLALKFDRNYLRHQLFPVINKRWPHAPSTLSKLAQQCAEDEQLLNELAQQDYESVHGDMAHNPIIVASLKGYALSISRLLQLNEVRQRNVLRFWLRNVLGSSPSRAILQQIQHTILHSARDAQPQIHWENYTICRYADSLYLLAPLPEHEPQQILSWMHLNTPLLLPEGLGSISTTWEVCFNHGRDILHLPEQTQLSVRFRQGGEKFHPVGRKGSHPLKKLMQEWKIPTWLRDYIPLLYYDGQLIAVPGFAIAAKYAAKVGESGYRIEWEAKVRKI